MTAAVGFPTLRLIRTRIGTIKLNNLKVAEVIEVDTTLLKMIDINMKNAINKIIYDYNVYQQTGVLKIK